MASSNQSRLDRGRRPRVHITYEVDADGIKKRTELPFVVGVVADLSGQPKPPLPPLKERKAVFIDKGNFNDVMARANVRLALRVPNKLTDPNSKLLVELTFKDLDDFGPDQLAHQIGPLKELLDMRRELTQLLDRMKGNNKLEQLLAEVLANTEKATAVARVMDAATGTQPQPEEPKP